MLPYSENIAACTEHGTKLKRDACLECNAAYMRAYQLERRRTHPAAAMLERARERARRRGLPFEIKLSDIAIPSDCPVLGIRIIPGRQRFDGSPSLDRISPHGGYVRGNVRVISDRANRLKGLHDLQTLQHLATTGRPEIRQDYLKIVAYVERETLLANVRARSEVNGPHSVDWQKIAKFLDMSFKGSPAKRDIILLSARRPYNGRRSI